MLTASETASEGLPVFFALPVHCFQIIVFLVLPHFRVNDDTRTVIRDFLKAEGLKIVSEDLEGDLPRRIHYYPDTGKVMMRKLKRKEDMLVVEEEKQYSQQLITKPVEGDIDLF